MSDFVSVIDPGGGGDYTSLAAWESTELPSTISAGDRYIAELVNGTHDEHSVVVGASVTTNNGEIIVRGQNSLARTGSGFDGTPGSGAVFNPTGTPSGDIDILSAGISGVTFEDFEVTESFGTFPGGAALNGLFSNGIAGTTYRRLLVGPMGAGTSVDFTAGIRADADATVVRCVAYGMVGDTTSQGIVLNLSNGEDQVCVNSVCHDCGTRGWLLFGGNTFTGSYQLENCIATGSTTDYAFVQLSGGGSETINSDISEDGTADDRGGSGHSTGVGSSIYIDAASGDFHLHPTNATAAYDNGVDLGTQADANLDVDGYDVDAAGIAWDIGFDQEGLDYSDNTSHEQEGFRWRADDGSETGATWLDSQDTNISRQADLNTRLRILTDITGNPLPEGMKLQYRRQGDSEWEDVQ